MSYELLSIYLKDKRYVIQIISMPRMKLACFI